MTVSYADCTKTVATQLYRGQGYVYGVVMSVFRDAGNHLMLGNKNSRRWWI